MRKFLLSMALVLCTMGAMAQTTTNTIKFTFARTGTGLTDIPVTVTVNDAASTDITATLSASATNVNSLMALSDNSIVCFADEGTGNSSKATVDAPHIYTLTINGLDGETLKNISISNKALTSGGDFQGTSVNRQRHYNVSYGTSTEDLTLVEDRIDLISVTNTHGSVERAKDFTVADVETGATLVIQLKMYNASDITGDEAQGCFYGLTGFTLTTEVEETVEPEPLVKTGQFYTINLTPGYTGTDRAGASMYVHSDAKLRCNKITGDITAKNVFVFEEGEDGNIYMKNVATQTYISAIGSNASQDAISADSETTEGALEISFGELGEKTVDGNTVKIIEIQPGNNAMLNCGSIDGEGLGRVVSFTPPSDKINKASAWYLTEVTDFKHTLEVGTAQWATVVLGFNATIPTTENFKAYTIASEEDGYVTLEEVTGVLAANVPVIVNAPQGNYDFAYTTETATVTTSSLQGTLYNKDITANAYVLGLIDGEVGFGKATTTGKAEGTFTNNANKAYFVPTNALANIASYSFRFGEGTTGISEVKGESGNVKGIYDLTGRRVEAITAPGIYIVGGKKVLVK